MAALRREETLAIFVDQESLSIRPHVLFPVHAFFGPNTVLFNDVFVGIGYKLIRQVELRNKFLMRLFVIGRNSDHNYVFLIKYVARITERTCFFGSARRVVFGIKPEYDAFTSKVVKADRISVLIFCREIWCFIAFF